MIPVALISTENFRKKLNCQEIVMLHRMTISLSTVVVAFLAAPVLNAAFPTTARAADNCLDTPPGDPPEGSRWYYQTNPVTGQKCWIIDAGKATVRDVGAQISRIGNAIRARSPPKKSVAPETAAVVLPRATAEANARLPDKTGLGEPVAEPFRRIKPESSPGSATAEVADENPAPPPFTSRWVNLWEQAHSSDRQPSSLGHSRIDQAALTVFHRVTNSSNADGHLFTAERLLYLILVVFVFLVSLGGALLLCGLTGGSFLYRRSGPAVRLNLPPLRDAFRVAELDDSSSPSPPAAAKPLNASGAAIDSRHRAEGDWQIAVDALLREVGEDQNDLDSPRGQRQAGGDQRLTNPFAGRFAK
jgi:hypothetical protein